MVDRDKACMQAHTFAFIARLRSDCNPAVSSHVRFLDGGAMPKQPACGCSRTCSATILPHSAIVTASPLLLSHDAANPLFFMHALHLYRIVTPSLLLSSFTVASSV